MAVYEATYSDGRTLRVNTDASDEEVDLRVRHQAIHQEKTRILFAVRKGFEPEMMAAVVSITKVAE